MSAFVRHSINIGVSAFRLIVIGLSARHFSWLLFGHEHLIRSPNFFGSTVTIAARKTAFNKALREYKKEQGAKGSGAKKQTRKSNNVGTQQSQNAI